MANEKISELPDGAPAQPTDEIPIARGGNNYRLDASAIAALGGGIGIGIGGNTGGVPSTLTSGTVLLVGGANITLSQNANSISIVGGAGGGGGFLAGVSNIGNTAGNTGVTGTELVLAGDNNITLSQFTSPSGATISISAFNQSVQTQNVIAASMGGNTSGALALVSSGTLFLAGGNNVTLSQNGNSVTISANTAAAATLSISAGTTSGAFNGVTFADSNNISWGLNNGTITATASQSVQTQASGAIAATGFTSTTTNGSVVVGTLNTSGLKLAVPPYITTQTVQTQNLHDVSLSGNTAGVLALISTGTMILAGGNNVTLSQNGQSITMSAANQTNQSIGLYASSQTVGQSSFSTADARSLSIVGAGPISIGLSNGSLLISGATAAPPTTAGIYATGNTTGQSFFSTYQQSSAIIQGAGIISVGWSSNSFIVSGPATTGISQSIYATGNTTQSSSGTMNLGSLLVQGTGGVSVGYTNGSLVISGATGGGGGAAIGMSTFGNTAGTTGTFSSGTVVLVGTGAVSLSQSTNTNGATITVSAPAQSNQVNSIYALGNTTNSSSNTINASAFSFSVLGGAATLGVSGPAVQLSVPQTSSLVGAGGVTVSVNGSTISVSNLTITRTIWPDQDLTALNAPGQGSASIQYMGIANPVTATRIDALFSWAGASSATTNTGAVVISAWAAIYTRNGSTLSSLSSGSTQTTYTYASNTAGNTQLISGAIRPVSVPVNVNMTQGEYYVAFNMSTNSSSVGASTTNLAQTISVMGGGKIQTAANYAEFTAQTANTTNLYGGMGVYSAQTAGLPAAISLSAINQTGSALSAANIAIVLRNG